MFIAMITLFLSLQALEQQSEEDWFGLDSLRNVFLSLEFLKALKKKKKVSLEI